jgi:serine/threonine-protein kinase
MSDSSSRDEVLSAGQIVDGRYLIDSVIGVGGMSVVYHGTHLLLDRPVALKVVSRALSSIPDARKRFLREARAIGRIHNDHVVSVYDVGVLGDGQPYLVMERLSGRDLGDVLDTSGPLPLEIAVHYVLQACSGLAEVHARGIIHRDLKPTNLFVATDESGSHKLKILDFGVSKLDAPDVNVRLTQQGAIVGTPAYMAPEQMRASSAVDGRADIWSLGIVLFELVAGSLPFESDSLADLLAELLTKPPPKLSARVRTVPPALDEVLARCFAFDPNDRHASVVQLAAALAPFGPPGSREIAAAIASLWDHSSMRPPALSISEEAPLSVPKIAKQLVDPNALMSSGKEAGHSENPVVITNEPATPASRTSTTLSAPPPRRGRVKAAALGFTAGVAALVAIGAATHASFRTDQALASVSRANVPVVSRSSKVDDLEFEESSDDATAHETKHETKRAPIAVSATPRKTTPSITTAMTRPARPPVAAHPTAAVEAKVAAAPPSAWEQVDDDDIGWRSERSAAQTIAEAKKPPPAHAGVVIDGKPLPSAELRIDGFPIVVTPDLPIPLEPGQHRVTAIVGGLIVWAAKIDIGDDEVVHVRIPAAYATAYDAH